MFKLGIIILNYNTYFDTVECVESILKQDYKQIEIIIVDNCSNDGSYEKFLKKFSKVKNISVIKNDKNLGFAKGNNVGIVYARKKLGCEFIFILNSDTIFSEKNICSILINSYKSKVAVINPACCNLDGSFQEPYGKFSDNLWKDTVSHFIFIIWSLFRNIFGIKISISNNLNKQAVADIDKYKYIVQGPAYILTPDFFEYYDRLFPNTFLYEEELLLAWYIYKAKLKTAFVKSPYIIHKEAGSSKEMVKSNKKLFLQLQSLYRGIPIFFLSKNKIKKYY